MVRRLAFGILAVLVGLVAEAYMVLASQHLPHRRVPILLDTDIGTDIDDAFALALILKSPEIRLLGVTTVSGDTEARARLAAKMLWEAGFRHVPVVAGKPGKPLPIDQARWAEGFTSPQLLREGAVDFLESEINRYPGKLTLVAIGPLTNIGALLQRKPTIGPKLKRIVLMGGSVAHGYGKETKPTAEYNIGSDPAAAQVVFSSGIPILMVPLDATAMLRLGAAARHRVFMHRSPLTNALTLLYHLWGHKTPVLYDPMTVALLLNPGLCQTRALKIEVDSEGLTRARAGGAPNAVVALHTDPQKFFDFLLQRLTP